MFPSPPRHLSRSPRGQLPRRHRQTRLARQALDRLGKPQALGLHHEVESAAVGAAAEAMVEALVLVDRERRRLLVVKWAQAKLLAPALDQPHPPADQLGKPGARPYIVEKRRRDRHYART